MTPGTTPTTQRTRLRGQRLSILERLRRGPVTNLELANIGIRYSARIKELRDLGYVIRTGPEEHGGMRVYTLIEEPKRG